MACAHTFMVIPNIQSNENSLPMRDRSMCHSNSIKPIDTNKREREKKYTYETTQMWNGSWMCAKCEQQVDAIHMYNVV